MFPIKGETADAVIYRLRMNTRGSSLKRVKNNDVFVFFFGLMEYGSVQFD